MILILLRKVGGCRWAYEGGMVVGEEGDEWYGGG